MNSVSVTIREIEEAHRLAVIELVHQFFKQVNSLELDGLFRIRPRAAKKFTDLYYKLQGTGKVYFFGAFLEQELVAITIARREEKPYLVEEKTLFVDLCVVKNGHKRKGVMTTLVNHLEHWAKEQGYPSLELRAITKNAEAVEFWRHMGYDPFFIRYRKRL